MKFLYKSVLLLGFPTISFFSASLVFAYPALYFKYRQLSINRTSCLSYAKQTIQEAGLKNVDSSPFASGGTTDSARTFITCTPIPKAGACGGEGSTVMFVVASDKNADDANVLLATLDKKFGNPGIIDCGTQLNPVKEP